MKYNETKWQRMENKIKRGCKCGHAEGLRGATNKPAEEPLGFVGAFVNVVKALRRQ